MENISLTCPDCGQKVTLGRRPAGNVVTCPKCDGNIAVPPPGEADDEAAGEYGVDLGRRCPECRREMPSHAVFCVVCGFNQKTGKKVKTSVRLEPIDRSWTYGLIPLGFFATLHVEREASGAAYVTHTQYLLYLPLIKTEVDLRECREVWLTYHDGLGMLGWTMFIFGLLLCGCPSVLVFLFYRQPNFYVELPRGKKTVTVYEGMSEGKMRDILETIQEAGGLKMVRKGC